MGELPATYVSGFHDEGAVKKMKYSNFGNTGLKVSQLSLGTAGFSYFYGNYFLDDCKATVHQALKQGINYIDTAPYYGYGVAEEILGQCLKGIPRQAYYLATKVGRYEKDPKLMFDFSAKKTRESIELSLKRLKVDYFDVVQVHDIDYASSLDIILEQTLPVLKEYRDKGKIRFIGITGYSVSVLANCIKQSRVKIDMILCFARLSMLDNALKEYIPFFQSKHLGIVNAAVHCQALLTSTGPPEWQAALQTIKDACTEAREYCKKNGVELGKLAMHYGLQQDGAHTVLVGMNNTDLLKSNLDVYYNSLSAKEKEVLDVVMKRIFAKLTKNDWEGVEVNNYLEMLKN